MIIPEKIIIHTNPLSANIIVSNTCFSVSNSGSCDINNANPYSAGIDFSRQNLTSVDVRFPAL